MERWGLLLCVALAGGGLRCDALSSAVAPSPTAEQDPPAPRPETEADDAKETPPSRADERAHMVDTIEQRGVDHPAVLTAMRKVPRHRFVPPSQADDAYADHPLPIGEGQTISQPYIVAEMSATVDPQPADRCLEIGTGSGYQAAVLAELCAHVYSIEVLESVAKRGKTNLRQTGYGPDQVSLRVGDGYGGWPSAAPFDVIVVTAAPPEVPEPLLEQLAVGGRMVIPVGPRTWAQSLELWTRLRKGPAPDAFEKKDLMSVRFVPFVRE